MYLWFRIRTVFVTAEVCTGNGRAPTCCCRTVVLSADGNTRAQGKVVASKPPGRACHAPLLPPPLTNKSTRRPRERTESHATDMVERVDRRRLGVARGQAAWPSRGGGAIHGMFTSSSTFLSEQTSHQQSVSSTFSSEQISHQRSCSSIFLQNKSTLAISHQPNEQAARYVR
jgi:hypothetical protein